MCEGVEGATYIERLQLIYFKSTFSKVFIKSEKKLPESLLARRVPYL